MLDMDCPRNRYIRLLIKDQSRVSHEWDKWDGTQEDGIRINDIQCDRAEKFKIKADSPLGLGIPCQLADKCMCTYLLELGEYYGLRKETA